MLRKIEKIFLEKFCTLKNLSTFALPFCAEGKERGDSGGINEKFFERLKPKKARVSKVSLSLGRFRDTKLRRALLKILESKEE
jgi:hypothetical protein